MDVDESNNESHPQHHHPNALTPKQERRLIEHLDTRFLELMRGFKKRSESTTHLPTLTHYLEAARTILALILQIPPIDPSTSLRIAYLLRLTNDVLCSIPGYPADPKLFAFLLDWLDDLDQAWSSVLQSQVWDPEEGEGVDLVISAEDAVKGVKSTPINQTESTRLRSLLIGGAATLEEWIAQSEKGSSGGGQAEVDVEGMLERMGLEDVFTDIFSATLAQLEGSGGVVVISDDVDPDEEAEEDEKMSE